jgi:hypothetical protein
VSGILAWFTGQALLAGSSAIADKNTIAQKWDEKVDKWSAFCPEIPTPKSPPCEAERGLEALLRPFSPPLQKLERGLGVRMTARQYLSHMRVSIQALFLLYFVLSNIY